MVALLGVREPFTHPSLELAIFTLDDTYVTTRSTFPSEGYDHQIRATAEELTKLAQQNGHSERLFTALYEALLNAHQHGSGLDPTKTVTIAYKVHPGFAEFVIVDEGSTVNDDLLQFLAHRRALTGGNIGPDFYEFSGKEKPRGNLGTGILLMHIYTDSVSYMRSPEGGLVVRLVIKNNRIAFTPKTKQSPAAAGIPSPGSVKHS